MNINEYNSDPRYWAVWEKMQLLQIEDVSTKRQDKNGTITWRLPIKNTWKNGKLIEVASFKTGYVRNNNSASSNYQLNKQIDGKPEYYKLSNGDYRKYTGKERVLIPIEIERLEYLISYCLKNYYIKHANFVANGDYIPKWRYDNLADAAKLDYKDKSFADKYKTDKLIELQKEIQTLEENLEDAVSTIMDHEEKIEKLQNKLQSVIRTARH